MKTKICKECQNEFEINRNNRRNIFCSYKCAAIYNNKNRKPPSEKTRKLQSESLKKYYQEHPETIRRGENQSKLVGNATKGTTGKKPKTIMELSKRTITKLLKRLNIGCSRCGWNESTCDIHHINGKKIPDYDNHDNLTIVCPNCHRLIHTHKIKKESLIPLSQQLQENWIDSYYG